MRTGIIGLGALGSSLGLALRTHKQWGDVTGFDTSARVQNDAKRKGAIREGTSDIADLLSDADLVVLAVPPLAVIDFLREYGPRLRADSVVTDLASSKQAILEAAERYVPARSGFVGGHPLVNCAPGIDQASATMFQGRPWCLATTVGTPADRLDTVNALVDAAGARAYFVDPAEHDSWVAGMEGLPRIMAAAVTPGANSFACRERRLITPSVRRAAPRRNRATWRSPTAWRWYPGWTACWRNWITGEKRWRRVVVTCWSNSSPMPRRCVLGGTTSAVGKRAALTGLPEGIIPNQAQSGAASQ